ncbi:MAG: adenylate/guanylate cyclase domain-containing protein [Ruegeria sp.]
MSKTSTDSLDLSNLRLAAFAFADVEGYTRHMEADSVAAARAWARLREGVLLSKIADYGGRFISHSGDAILVEFASATNAVRWALHVQMQIREEPTDEIPMRVRIGINLDDVVDDGRSLQSDGVVIASRIQDLATAGDVILTQQVRDIVRNRINVRFHEIGTPVLKNIARPVRVFVVHEGSELPSIVQPHAHWDSRPSLAILPFRDLLDVDEDRYFGEGITEDIIAGVSRSRAMFVVARTSTLQFTDEKMTSREVAAALGVSYLLSGSVRRKGGRLRIHTELVDVIRNRAVWADNFDGDKTDLFEFQDRIVSSIVAAVEPRVQRAEAANLSNRPTESLDAYDSVLRALPELYRFEGQSYENARLLFKRAVELDPGYAQAHTYLAWCQNFWIAEGHSKDVAKDRDIAVFHARKAVELDPEDALNLSVRGHILSVLERRPHEAVDLLDQALALNPNLPLAWGLSATTHAYLGNGQEARERMLNVWRLTPFDPLDFFFWTACGLGEFVDGHYSEAITALQRARRTKPHFMAALRILAASYALDGQKEQARRMAERILSEDPGFSISRFMAWYPLNTPDSRERLVLGLSTAGLPN